MKAELKYLRNGEPKLIKWIPDTIEEFDFLSHTIGMRVQRDGSYHFPVSSFLANEVKNSFGKVIFDKPLTEMLSEWETKTKKIRDLWFSDEKNLPESNLPLYDYQKRDKLIMEVMRRCINGNDMGLGKTLETISVITKGKKTLIVCPSSLKYNWESEIEKFRPELTVANTNFANVSLRKKSLSMDKDIYIVNYEMLKDSYKEIFETEYDLVVFDEAHRLKNPKTYWYRYFEKNGKYDRLLLLTGTPVSQNPLELWSLLHLIDPKEFSSQSIFMEHFCELAFNPFSMSPLVVGVKNKDKLHEMLLPYLFRRKKEDVLELPEKQYITVSLTLPEKIEKLYKKLLKEKYLNIGSKMLRAETGMEVVLRARQLVLDPKILGITESSVKTDTILELIEDMKQVVIFTVFKHYANNLKEALKKNKISVSMYTGDTSEKERTKSIQDFVSGKTKVFLATVTAGGVGLNLQNAHDVIFADKPYNPAILKQAEDRCHRNGQKHPVTIYYLCMKNTVDEIIDRILKRKEKITDDTLIIKEVYEELLKSR